MGRYEIPIGRGAMRHTITLQARTEAADQYGQPRSTWADVSTHRAHLEQTRGSIPVDAGIQKPQRSGVITCPYFEPRPDELTNRFLFGQRVLHIVEVERPEEKASHYKILYQELPGEQP